MGFRAADSNGNGGYARVWTVDNKGKYSVCKLSTSKKNKDKKYEKDFQHNFVRFIGDAHEKINSIKIPEKGITIQITGCDVTTPYNARLHQRVINYLVFAFNIPESNTENSEDFEDIHEDIDDDLPF